MSALAGFLTHSSCTKSDAPPPVIHLTELGYENSRTVSPGSDLHFEADIVAEGKIDYISLEIHPEGDHGKAGSVLGTESEWEVDTVYTGFTGLKNTLLHEHVEVPANTGTGTWHFYLRVTDLLGQQTILEEEISIQHP